MSFWDFLIHQARLLRPSVAGEDAHGNPIYSWDEIARDVPCRLVEHLEQMRGGAEGVVLVERHKILWPTEVVPQNGDEVRVDRGSGEERWVVVKVLPRSGRGLLYYEIEVRRP